MITAVQRIATMINYGTSVEEIHDHPDFDVQDEGTFFLIYKAAEIIAADRTAGNRTLEET